MGQRTSEFDPNLISRTPTDLFWFSRGPLGFSGKRLRAGVESNEHVLRGGNCG